MPYPVSLAIQPQFERRNRLTTAFRPLLALPHAILAGPVYWSSRTGGVGLLGAAAYVLAIVSWFTLVIVGTQPAGIRDFMLYYLRWRTRALAYMALFIDGYPPFGDGVYPASIQIAATEGERDLWSIASRLVLVIPHVFVLCFLLIGWFVVTVVAWFAILFTGVYPRSLWPFAFGVMQWALRVEGYLLLLVDDYPPFELGVPPSPA